MSSDYTSPGQKIWITGHELRLQGNYELAIELFSDILNSSVTIDEVLKIDTLNELVICYSSLNEYELAVTYSWEALELIKKCDHKIGQANAYLNLGSLAYLSQSFKEAKEFFRQALKIFELELQDELGIARSLIYLGLISREEGMLEKAEGDLYTAYKLLEKNIINSDYRNTIFRILNHLGTTKLIESQFLEAINIYNDAIKLIDNTKDESKKALILRNLSLCYFILDNDNFLKLINESIAIAITRKHKSEEFLSKLFLLVHYYNNRDILNQEKLIRELKSIIQNKYSNNYFYLLFFEGLTLHEINKEQIFDCLSEMENYFRINSSKIKFDQNLILMQIELMRVLADHTKAIKGKYSFGLTRKYEKLIRIARGHKDDRVIFICYTYLLDLLIPTTKKNENTIQDGNIDSVFNLMKQMKSDITQPFFTKLFILLDIIINLYYTMEFTENITKLIELKNYFAEQKMVEFEIRIFKLEYDFTEKLSKLAEISEEKNIDNIKALIYSYQSDLRENISNNLRFFRMKVIQILILLNTIALK